MGSQVMAGVVNHSLHGIGWLLWIVAVVAAIVWIVGYFRFHRAPTGRYSYGYWGAGNPYHGAGVVALIAIVLLILFA